MSQLPVVTSAIAGATRLDNGDWPEPSVAADPRWRCLKLLLNRRGRLNLVVRRRDTMRLFEILMVLSLQGVSFAQLTSPPGERNLPGEFERTTETPKILAAKTSLTFIDFTVIFDGGSYGARFRREDGEHLVVYFLHAGYWSEQAITKRAQPIVVQLSQKDDEVRLEVAPNSEFEKRLLELLKNDLSNKVHSRAQIETLTRLRGCIADRKPLAEIQKRLPTRSERDP